ncbi:MAG: helix-hairpin-helix domain-containing protein [Acidobacteriota bacterium]
MADPTLSDFNEALRNLNRPAEDLRQAALEKSEVLERSRGTRLVGELAICLARFGQDSARTEQALARLADQAGRTLQLQAARQATELGRRVQPDQVTVLGRVADDRERPDAKLRVFLSNEGGPQSPLQEGGVESSGFYLLGVSRSRFDQYFRRSQEIVVSVTDADRKILAQERRPFERDDQTVVRVFNFTLPPETPATDGSAAPEGQLEGIKGLGPRRIARLREQGIENLRQLAATEVSQLASLLRIGEEQANRIIEQARRQSGAAPRD